jgi:hypothetical protein
MHARPQLSRDPLGGTVLKRTRPRGLTVLAVLALLAGVGGAIQSVQVLLGAVDLSAVPPPEAGHVREFLELNRPFAIPNLLAGLWFALAGAGLLFLREWARRLMEWFWWSWVALLAAFVLASALHSADLWFSLAAGSTVASPLAVLGVFIIRYLRTERVRSACAA